HEQTNNIGDWHVCANLRELEPEQPIKLMVQLSRCAGDAAKRSLLLRTIADGCRASLSGLYHNKLAELANDPKVQKELGDAENCTPRTSVTPPCRKLQDWLIKE